MSDYYMSDKEIKATNMQKEQAFELLSHDLPTSEISKMLHISYAQAMAYRIYYERMNSNEKK